MASSSTATSSTPHVPPTDLSAAQGFERCAKRYEVEAKTYARGLQTALFIRRFKQGLLGRS